MLFTKVIRNKIWPTQFTFCLTHMNLWPTFFVTHETLLMKPLRRNLKIRLQVRRLSTWKNPLSSTVMPMDICVSAYRMLGNMDQFLMQMDIPVCRLVGSASCNCFPNHWCWWCWAGRTRATKSHHPAPAMRRKGLSRWDFPWPQSG